MRLPLQQWQKIGCGAAKSQSKNVLAKVAGFLIVKLNQESIVSLEIIGNSFYLRWKVYSWCKHKFTKSQNYNCKTLYQIRIVKLKAIKKFKTIQSKSLNCYQTRVLARPYLMMFNIIFPIRMNFPIRSG